MYPKNFHMRHFPDHGGPSPGVSCRWQSPSGSPTLVVDMWSQGHNSTETLYLCSESVRTLRDALTKALGEEPK